MDRQLHLLTAPADASWRLDPDTRAIGRRGLAQARAALQAARATRSSGATSLAGSRSSQARRPAA